MSIPKVLTGHEIKPVFEDKQAIVFESSQLFVPYMDVALISLLQNTEDRHNYDIIIGSMSIVGVTNGSKSKAGQSIDITIARL